jgi:hypothetical protein
LSDQPDDVTCAQDAAERTIAFERQGLPVKDVTDGKIARNLPVTLLDLRRYKCVKISMAAQDPDWTSNYQMIYRKIN